MSDTTGARYFHPDYGLKAYEAMRAVANEGPLMADQDGRFWGYAGGVWRDAERDVARRIARILGQRYRPHHQKSIEAVLRVELPEIELQPVSAYLNMANGMLRWDADPGPEILEHHPEYMSTVQLPIDWVTEATCPRFDAFLEQSVPPDDRQRVWEILGYLMMSGNPLQRMFLLTGGGGNGKGVLLHVIKHLVGQRNMSAVPLHEFSDSQFATAELFGKLANICGDIDATYIESTGRIKEMSGEDDMKGERKFGQPFYFRFWGKAIFSANAIPGAADASRGWVRRWEVVSFPYEHLSPDTRLKERLTTVDELQGIAVKAVYALRGLMARGTFDHGVSAEASHREFAQKSNKVLLWVAEECDTDDTQWYERGELLRVFRVWDEAQSPGGRKLNAQTFYERLRMIPGVRDAKRKGNNGFKGLRLKAHVATFPPAEQPTLVHGLWPAETP